VVEYCTDLFRHETITRLVSRFRALLEAALADPERRLSQLELLEPAERAQVVEEWNASARPYDLERSFAQMFAAQVERTPEATAAACAGETLSYRALDLRAGAVARELCRGGVGRDAVVALLAPRGLELLAWIVGVHKAGAAYLPLDPQHPAARLRQVLEQSRAAWVLATREFAGVLDEAVQALPGARPQALWGEPLRGREAGFSAAHTPGPRDLAYVIFTSGSTGTPKGVINTHRMLCSNQQSWAQLWPFLEERVHTIVDWLPWNHTFGGNACFNMILRNGGALYIDGGKPAPGLIDVTAKNLREISPTLYFNVPRGFDLLMPMLETDAGLRANFFRDLDMVFYAGAALPQNLWERLEKLALSEKAGNLAMLSAWGSTETAPMASCVHFPIERAGVVGNPAPGCELKLLPSGGKLEVRVKGANVTPGYYRRDDLTQAAFDEEGYYRIGDAMKFADPAAPEKGLVFDGRVAEDFKLTTGTWVHVGAVRVKLIAAGNPIIQDAVITGHDRDEVGALVFLNPGAAKDLSVEKIRERLSGALQSLSSETGSSTHPVRLLVMSEPPQIDAGEITDKGYINQRAVLERRAALVEQLYANPPAAEVIVPGG
jgi:feruloyl-CoA synthase